MTEQWQELKETITEMRDNNGTGTQQDVCKFLANYMEILEKQMQQPCEDCISRDETLKAFAEKCGGECGCCVYNGSGYDSAENCKLIKSIPSVTPQRKKGRWIEQKDIHKHHYGWSYCSECGAFLISSDGANYCSCCGAEMEAEA